MTTQKRPRHYDVVISGKGPAGLAAAYEASKAGLSVLILESRSGESNRPQLVHLDKNSTSYLFDMLPSHEIIDGLKDEKDKVFTEKFEDSYEHYGIKDIERYLMRRLKEEKNCVFMSHTMLKNIDLDEGIATVEKKSSHTETLSFNYLIGADGARHHAANLLKIPYKSAPTRRLKHHVTGYFTLKAHEGSKIKLPEEEVLFIQPNPSNVGLIYPERSSQIKSKGERMKVCITASLSEANYKAFKAHPEKANQYLKETLKKSFPHCDILLSQSAKGDHKMNPDKLAKDQLKIQPFVADRVTATKVVIKNKTGTAIYAGIGDVNETPDFYQGHGVNNAFVQSRALGFVFRKEASLNDYEKLFNEISAENSRALVSHEGMVESIIQSAQKNVQETSDKKLQPLPPEVTSPAQSEEKRTRRSIDNILDFVESRDEFMHFIKNHDKKPDRPSLFPSFFSTPEKVPNLEPVYKIYQLLQEIKTHQNEMRPEDLAHIKELIFQITNAGKEDKSTEKNVKGFLWFVEKQLDLKESKEDKPAPTL